MPRVDDPTVYNPYGWRLAALADPATSDDRRRQLQDDLVVWEAQEAAHGYRHVTVVHGDPVVVEASRRLSRFYDAVRDLASRLGWVRVRGAVDAVTITVRGDDAEERLADFVALAGRFDPGGWEIVATAYPPVTAA